MDDQNQQQKNRTNSAETVNNPVIEPASQPEVNSVQPDLSQTATNQAQQGSGDNGFADSAGKFLFGGTKNVDTIDTFKSKNAVIALVIYVISLLLLAAISYLHYKKGDSWLEVPFLIVVILSVCNIIYFGWIKRELLMGKGIMWNVVRGGTAFAVSFLYLAGIAIVAGVGWNYSHISKSNTNSSTGSTVQTSK